MPHIHIRTRTLEYKFDFNNKYLIINGDSGRGKSELVNLVGQLTTSPDVVECLGDSNLEAFTSLEQLNSSNRVFFLDEGNQFLWRGDINQLFGNSDNYFVIICRERRPKQFKLSLDGIVDMQISADGKLHTIKPHYPKRDHLDAIGTIVRLVYQ